MRARSFWGEFEVGVLKHIQDVERIVSLSCGSRRMCILITTNAGNSIS